MTHRLMSDDEKFAVWQQATALRDAGKEDEAMTLDKTVPMPPWLAKFFKERGLTDYLIKSGWNMAEVEAEYGPGWLTR
ncbi:MAG: hypothetical protein LBR16_03125 [Treponema sp.]|nr:hypothetical protein [Treponema sp.]